MYGFFAGFGAEEAYGLFTDFDRIWGRRRAGLFAVFTGCKGGGLRMAYGFLSDLGEEAYRLLTDFYRM